MNLTKLDALYMVSEIEKEGKRIKPNEKRFLESIKTMFYSTLTMPQSKFLKDIYQRVTGGGAFQDKQRF